MADPMIFLEAGPNRQQRRGGIKAITGEFVAAERLLASAGIQWVDEGCGLPQLAPGLCWGEQVADPDKALDGFPVMQSVVKNFALYSGVECYAGPGTDFPAAAAAKLQAGEDRGVEKSLLTHLEGLTPDANVADVVAAIAALEDEADAGYVGLPVLVMSRGLATQAKAAGALVEGRGGLPPTTVNGTPVLATGMVSAAERTRVWITGGITVYAGDVVSNVATDFTKNRQMAIAERGYGVAIDCAYTYDVEITAP